jgi:hypothetical protein
VSAPRCRVGGVAVSIVFHSGFHHVERAIFHVAAQLLKRLNAGLRATFDLLIECHAHQQSLISCKSGREHPAQASVACQESPGDLLRDVGNMIPEAEAVFENQFRANASADKILDDARKGLMLRNLRGYPGCSSEFAFKEASDAGPRCIVMPRTCLTGPMKTIWTGGPPGRYSDSKVLPYASSR